MSLALTIALCLRDDEARLAAMVKTAVEVAGTLIREHAAGEWRDGTREEPEDLSYELLALDESSRDNTPSVLSILHARLPLLRSIQDLAPGTAVMRAARSALGRSTLYGPPGRSFVEIRRRWCRVRCWPCVATSGRRRSVGTRAGSWGRSGRWSACSRGTANSRRGAPRASEPCEAPPSYLLAVSSDGSASVASTGPRFARS
jgi:hypothetical protein